MSGCMASHYAAAGNVKVRAATARWMILAALALTVRWDLPSILACLDCRGAAVPPPQGNGARGNGMLARLWRERDGAIGAIAAGALAVDGSHL